MKIAPQPLTVIQWHREEATRHAGEEASAVWKTRQFGDIRLRMVEYAPGYVADHWCAKGHVIHCVAGAIEITLRDGTRQQLNAGETYFTGDGEPAHRSISKSGAMLFIVD